LDGKLKTRLTEITAHEIGHSPGGQSGPADHAEGGLMEKEASYPDFTSQTIRRFRKTGKWDE